MRAPRRRSRLVVIRAAGAAVLVGAAGALSGCGSTMGLPEPATTQGDEVVSLWQIFLSLAIAVSALIWILTAYVVVSSIRRRRHAEAKAAADDRDTSPPRQLQYNTKVEMTYTVLPIVLVIVLLVFSFRANAVLTDTSQPSTVNIDVIGFQWQWQFQYYDTDPEQPYIVIAGDPTGLPVLMLPVGRNVLFSLYANDVIHSFWVPEFLEKRDLIPGIDDPPNKISVFVKNPGEWQGRCAEYCGFNHWLMQFKVKAVPADEFDRWVETTRRLPQPHVAGAGTVVPATSTTVVPITTAPPTVPIPPVSGPDGSVVGTVPGTTR